MRPRARPWLSAALLSWPGSAAGQDGPAPAHDFAGAAVSVQGPRCEGPAFDTEALLALLRLELGREVSLEPATPGLGEGPAVRVELHASNCDPERAEVRVDILHPEAPLRVALGGVPPAARARTLALVIAEALRSAELAASSEPSSATPSNALALARSSEWGSSQPLAPGLGELFHKSAPYPPTSRLRLRGLLQARFMTAGSDLLFGIEGGVSGALSNSLDWAIDLSYASGEASRDSATIDWWSGGFGLDVSPTGLQALRLAGRLSLGRMVLVWEPLGVGTDHLAPALGARVTLRVPPQAPTAVDIMLDATHTFALASLNGAPAPSRIEGWVVSWGMGAAFAP